MVKDIILKQYEQFGKSIVLLGHSKGGTDAAAACAMYWDELKDKLRGLVMLQAPYGGTPLAADLLRGGQFGALNAVFLGKLATMTNPEVIMRELMWGMTWTSLFSWSTWYHLPVSLSCTIQLLFLAPEGTSLFQIADSHIQGRKYQATMANPEVIIRELMGSKIWSSLFNRGTCIICLYWLSCTIQLLFPASEEHFLFQIVNRVIKKHILGWKILGNNDEFWGYQRALMWGNTSLVEVLVSSVYSSLCCTIQLLIPRSRRTKFCFRSKIKLLTSTFKVENIRQLI